MKKLQPFMLLLFLVPAQIYSQEYQEILRNIFFDAEYYLMEESYPDALVEYQKLYTRGYKDNANINYRMGICYLSMPGEKDKAIPYLAKAAQNTTIRYKEGIFSESKAAIDVFLYLGNAYRIVNELDRAIDAYNKYKELLGEKDPEMLAYADQQIMACNNARTAMEKPVYFIREHTGERINGTSSDYNPVVSQDEQVMIYMTRLKFYNAINMATKADGEWSAPINLTPQIQSDGDQHVNCLSLDGKEMYLNKEDNFNSDIYYSKFEGNQWLKSVPLGKRINTKYWESHASISPDGKELLLASNRKDSYGGMDIYVSTLDERGEWSEPVNLGDTINTELNEDNPFFSADGKRLYFSSQGHYNIGGYDIFYADRQADGSWGKPVNLGYPLNTTDDDLFFMPLADGKLAYQAIFDDENIGSRDIYRFQLFDTEAEYLAAITPPEPIIPVDTTPVEVPEEPARVYVLSPVYFGFDKYTVIGETRTTLNEVRVAMEAVPELKIEAVGHTDSKGSDTYNMGLSRRRAESVVEFLVKSGIDAARIKSSGMGETAPVARNTNPNGSDSPEGRKLNRRVEFSILTPDLPNVEVAVIEVPAELHK
jgi:outer membrane protein OmpA-like peptidoglycan-associated protein